MDLMISAVLCVCAVLAFLLLMGPPAGPSSFPAPPAVNTRQARRAALRKAAYRFVDTFPSTAGAPRRFRRDFARMLIREGAIRHG